MKGDWDDLIERLEGDDRLLQEKADNPARSLSERQRLLAKASGVRLALSKVQEHKP